MYEKLYYGLNKQYSSYNVVFDRTQILCGTKKVE